MKTQRGRRPAWQAHNGGTDMQANTYNPIVARPTPSVSSPAPVSGALERACPASGDAKLLYTIAEAAEMLSISRAHLNRLVARGDVASILVGGRCRRVSRATLEAYVAGLEAEETGGAR